MKKNFKHILAAAILFIVPLVSGAQALKGSYFLDNSMNRHEMNPAFAPRADYFQMLGIGNLGLGLGTNLGIPTFFYPGDNELLPFLNQKVSVEDFDKVLSLNLLKAAEKVRQKEAEEAAANADPEIDALVLARTEAKKAKNYAEADRIRDELKAMGIEIIDTPQGAKWRRV